jgi:hypothetical protein
MFKVQAKICSTCIYKAGFGWRLADLLEQIADKRAGFGFVGYRSCHHTPDESGVCCRGFWNAHKDDFQSGQIAQRLGLVEFVDVDDMGDDDALRESDAGSD